MSNLAGRGMRLHLCLVVTVRTEPSYVLMAVTPGPFIPIAFPAAECNGLETSRQIGDMS